MLKHIKIYSKAVKNSNEIKDLSLTSINNDLSNNNKVSHELLDNNKDNNKKIFIQIFFHVAIVAILITVSSVLYIIFEYNQEKVEKIEPLNIKQIQYKYHSGEQTGIDSNSNLFLHYDEINEEILTDIHNDNNITNLIILLNDNDSAYNFNNLSNMEISTLINDKLIENHYDFKEPIVQYNEPNEPETQYRYIEDQYINDNDEIENYSKEPINLNSIEIYNNNEKKNDNKNNQPTKHDHMENIGYLTNEITIPKDDINEDVLDAIHKNTSIEKLIVSNVDYLYDIYQIFQCSHYKPPQNIYPYNCEPLPNINIEFFPSLPNISDRYIQLTNIEGEKYEINNKYYIGITQLTKQLKNNKHKLLEVIKNNIDTLLICNIPNQYKLEQAFKQYNLYIDPSYIKCYNINHLNNINITYRWTGEHKVLLENLEYTGYKIIKSLNNLENNIDTHIAINKKNLSTSVLEKINNDAYIKELMIFNIGKRPYKINQINNVNTVQEYLIGKKYFIHIHNISIYTRKLIYINTILYTPTSTIGEEPKKNEYILSKDPMCQYKITVEKLKALNLAEHEHINTLIMIGVNSKQEVINLLYHTDFHGPKHPSIIYKYDY